MLSAVNHRCQIVTDSAAGHEFKHKAMIVEIPISAEWEILEIFNFVGADPSTVYTNRYGRATTSLHCQYFVHAKSRVIADWQPLLWLKGLQFVAPLQDAVVTKQ